ncbi:MAG TPA: hypothetical protein VLD39_08205, partial [Gammaproteobacteria bacterium]|nr:hypothetical protein [Gammaproteobacteria bacterium]
MRRASGAPEEDGVLALHSSAGIDHSLVEQVVELLVNGAPSIAIAGVDPGGGRLGPSTERAIASLNLTLDSIGAMGGLAARAELPSPLDDAPLAAARELDELPDWSVGLLIVDASSGDAAISWPAVRRKLSVGAIVVALTPFLAGTARHADLAIPTPAFLEAVGELPTPIDSPRARFALSAPILAAREGSVDPGTFIRMLADRTGSPLSGNWKTSEELMRVRVERIHAMGRGRIVSPEADAEPASGISSPDQLWSTLVSGRWWEDDASAVAAIQWNVPDGLDASDAATSQALTLAVQGSRDVTASAVASPVMTKLYQESKLRREANVVV